MQVYYQPTADPDARPALDFQNDNLTDVEMVLLSMETEMSYSLYACSPGSEITAPACPESEMTSALPLTSRCTENQNMGGDMKTANNIVLFSAVLMLAACTSKYDECIEKQKQEYRTSNPNASYAQTQSKQPEFEMMCSKYKNK